MKLELIKASDVEIKEVEWLWYPYIPYGKVTVLQGDSGDGKSTFVLNLAAMLSRGEPMPFTDGSGQEPVNIIYQSSEDDADDTIVPRFVKAGGDPNRLIFISEKEKYLSFSDERLLEAVRKTNAKLIVLDPLSAYIGEETRINTANEIRRQFRPLIELAKEQRCAMLVEKIVVYEPRAVDGVMRQQLDVYYRYIGVIKLVDYGSTTYYKHGEVMNAAKKREKVKMEKRIAAVKEEVQNDEPVSA